jgi:hypothetical protein
LISNVEAEELRAICQETLGWLAEYGFGESRLSSDPGTHTTTVRLYGSTLAIECVWDSRDEALDVKVARLVGGEAPEQYNVDGTGRRVRGHLTSVLVRHGVRGFGFRPVPTGASRIERWRIALEDYARLLRQHGDFILRQDADALE